ncbi:MAG: His-Xaa-Ser system radical SAM maturase HxsB [Candidatus Acidiferrales bacterium]
MSEFHQIESYKPRSHDYRLLPFRFTELNDTEYVLSNIAGDFLVLPKNELRQLINHQLADESAVYIDLRARHFLTDDSTRLAPDLLAIKLRSRYERLADFTGLHLFVVTLRCEHSCQYCQVSRQSDNKIQFDMSVTDADAALGLALRSPASTIKIEFQGGEPLLNFPLIAHIVREAERRNVDKRIEFVIATNLALVDRDILTFCAEHEINISTSLDGPQDLHNSNRPRPGGDSYERTIDGIRTAREFIGSDRVGALMTTTERSLGRVKDIIDEYLLQRFDRIFLRPLSPYGFAIKTKSYMRYNTDRWLDFYKQGLEYVISLNKQGIAFTEFYASTILAKMFTSRDPGYVDLMSPAGIGIAAVVYNYDGYVYASDESRMLAEMGDHHFRLGHVRQHSYEDIFLSPSLINPLEDSFAYSNPMCHDCAFEPYCGADPVFHWATHGDHVGLKPESEFCRRNMAICRHLIESMRSDPFVRRLFVNWANRC